MPLPKIYDIAEQHLFTDAEELAEKYKVNREQIRHLMRIRDMYVFVIHHPSTPDREIIEDYLSKFDVCRTMAYNDLAVVKAIIPRLSQTTKEYHRHRFNELIMETYNKAKEKDNLKAMVAALAAYSKANMLDAEDEHSVDYEVVAIQPFTATSDPTVLGIKPIPNLNQRIAELKKKYSQSDIEDIDYEEADVTTEEEDTEQ